MSKKDFIALADAIREHNRLNPNDQFTAEQLSTLGDFCKAQNSNFMRERWTGYISGDNGPSGGSRKAGR
jgi:hypothetical protein